MERDPRSFLWDVRESADAILRFVAGRAIDDYLGDDMLRSAVERNFEIIGEALSQLKRFDPELAAKVPSLSDAIAFRNLLIHGYAQVDHRVVWRTVQQDLPGLRGAVKALLGADLPPSPKPVE